MEIGESFLGSAITTAASVDTLGYLTRFNVFSGKARVFIKAPLLMNNLPSEMPILDRSFDSDRP